MVTLATHVGVKRRTPFYRITRLPVKTSSRGITHLAKMSIDPKLVKLTADDVFLEYFYKHVVAGFLLHRTFHIDSK